MRVPAAVHVPLINRLKVMANLDIARPPLQQGVLRIRTQGEEFTLGIEVRLRGDAEEALLHLPPRGAERDSQEIDAATEAAYEPAERVRLQEKRNDRAAAVDTRTFTEMR